MDEHEKALEYHDKALVIQKKVFENNHHDTANTYKMIGNCYNNMNEMEDALDNYYKALEIYESLEGFEDEVSDIKQAIEDLE